jgi:hypothetical protein
MKRIAIISAILTVVLGLDGIYMTAAKYKAKDVNQFNLSDGGTIIVAALILLLITIVAAVLANRPSPQEKSE